MYKTLTEVQTRLRFWDKNNACFKFFQILSGTDAQWVQAYPKYVPKNAFIGGSTGRDDPIYGEPLYIGRAVIDGKVTCGKVYHHGSSCYFPYYDQEVTMSLCEILVEPDDEWWNLL